MKPLCFCALCLVAPAGIYAAPATELPPAVQLAFEDYTALPDRIVPHLKNVRDRASADAAAPQLHQALSSIYITREKLHRMPRLTPAQNQLVRQKYSQRMRENWGKLYAEISRLQNEKCYQSAPFAETFHLLCMMIEK